MWKAALPSCQNIGQCLLREPWAEFWRVVSTWGRRACLWPSSIRFQKWAYYLAARIQNLRAQSSMYLTGGEPGQTDQGWMTWHVTFGRLFTVPTSLSEVNPNLFNLPVGAVPWPFLGCFGAVYWKNSFPWPAAAWSSPKREANLVLLQKMKMMFHLTYFKPGIITNAAHAPPLNKSLLDCISHHLLSEAAAKYLWSQDCISDLGSTKWPCPPTGLWSRCLFFLDLRFFICKLKGLVQVSSSNCTFLPLASHSFLFFVSLLHWSKIILQGIPGGTVVRALSFQKKKKEKEYCHL